MKKLQKQVRKLRSENVRLKRQLCKFSVRGKKSTRQTASRTARKQRFGAIRQAARELGFRIEDVATGGGSDGNYTAALGVPTIDGLGPIGGKSHNAMEEWLDDKSIVPRVAMLAKLIVKIAEEK